MIDLDSGTLDRMLVILGAAADQDDGTATLLGQLKEIGRRSASREDISDGERVRAAQNGEEVTTRFIVRSDSLTRIISGKNTLTCDGESFAVVGTKEVGGRRVGIEITANAQPDEVRAEDVEPEPTP